jgi:hypothetical protein
VCVWPFCFYFAALTQGEAAFQETRTAHFVVTSDASAEDVSALSARLESTYQAVVRFARQIDFPLPEPQARLPVTLFDRHEDFRTALRAAGLDAETFVGFYDQKSNRSFFCNAEHLPQVDAIPPGPQRAALVEQIHRLVVAHETAHQVLFNVGLLSRGADHPEWWVEGLACLFETPPAADGGIVLNRLRLADLREGLAAGRGLQLRDLTADAGPSPANAHETRLRYAKAWALTEFMRQKDPDAFRLFAKLQTTQPIAPPSSKENLAIFQNVFGPPDDDALLGWIRALP